MRRNVLITSVGKRVALVKIFKETSARFFDSIKIYTTDMIPEMAPAGYVSDDCFQVPRVTNSSYVQCLLSICIEHDIGMIIPTIDTELSILAENRALFESQGIKVIVSDKNFIAVCRDKRNTGDFFLSRGIRIPQPIDRNAPTFPLFAKPYDGSLSKDLYYVACREDLTPEILSNTKLMFMEYIDKSIYKEFTVDMYYDKSHRLKSIVPRERMEIRAGEISKGRTVKSGLMDYLKFRFEKIDGCIGCICMQVFFNRHPFDIVGIEINPRFGGGYPLSYAAGANFPELLIREYFFNEPLFYADDWKDNLLMLRYDDAVYV